MESYSSVYNYAYYRTLDSTAAEDITAEAFLRAARFFESFDRGPYEQDVNSAAWYEQGLGWKALGRNGKAKRCFKKSLAERNDNLWANYYLGILK